MTIKVLLFGPLRDALGANVEVDLPDDATAADLIPALTRAHPRHAPLLRRCAVAVDCAFARPATPLAPAAEIALIPPVSGGSAQPEAADVNPRPVTTSRSRRAAG